MSRFYLAARYSRHPEMQGYARTLTALGHEVTARWLWGGHDLRAREMGYASSDDDELHQVWAQEDWDDLMAAEVFVAFTEAPGADGRQRGGRHVELGAALASGKRVVIVGPRENVFCWMPAVTQFPTWAACLESIDVGVLT